jgi:ATP-binding cassette subfamily C protein CydC
MTGRIGAQAEAVMAADARLAQAEDALNRLDGRSGALLFLAGQAALVVTLLVSATLVERQEVSAAIAAFALLAALAGLEAFAPLRRGALELGRAWLAARRLGPRLDVAETPRSRAGSAGRLALRLSNITLRHEGAARPVLAGLNLEIAEGECVALVGESGAGKSSILALIAGELAPEAGSPHPGLPHGVDEPASRPVPGQPTRQPVARRA